MKKILLPFFFLAALTPAFCQSDTTQSITRRNEIGLDATGFIKYFTQIVDPWFGGQYVPRYILTYRHYFKAGNIRTAIGGNIFDSEVPLSYSITQDPILLKRSMRTVDVKLGWEFTNELSSRWQAFYGLDILASIVSYKNDYSDQSSISNYVRGNEMNGYQYGIAPILGFRFRVNKRICLIAESSVSLVMASISQKEYYTYLPNSNNPNPTLPEVRKWPDSKDLQLQYRQPISIIFTFTL